MIQNRYSIYCTVCQVLPTQDGIHVCKAQAPSAVFKPRVGTRCLGSRDLWSGRSFMGLMRRKQRKPDHLVLYKWDLRGFNEI